MITAKGLLTRLFTAGVLLLLLGLTAFPANQADAQAPASGNPILLVTADVAGGYGWGKYLAEILRAEGLNSFDQSDVSEIDQLGDLAGYQAVVLAANTTAGRGDLLPILESFVSAGGGVVAMRPDGVFNGLFGLADDGQVDLADGYLMIDPTQMLAGTAVGSGLASESLQIHGAARRQTLLAGGIELAGLLSDSSASTGSPAISARPLGDGWAVAYAYDLAANIILTRQGNPAGVDVINPTSGVKGDTDGDGVFRTTDLFQLAGGGTWIDREKIHLPQADLQMRHFGRIIKRLVNQRQPQPQFWYFPNDQKTMLVLTGDVHADPIQYEQEWVNLIEAHPGAEFTFFLSWGADPNDSYTVMWWNDFRISSGIHPSALPVTDPAACQTELCQGYRSYARDFWPNYHTLTPMSRAVRNDQMRWEGWTQSAQYAQAQDIRLDANYCHYGGWLQLPDGEWPHGSITGSGLPMKFIDQDGTLVNVYQQLTQLADEHLFNEDASTAHENLTDAQAADVAAELMRRSQDGDYQALMTQIHADFAFIHAGWLDLLLDEAQTLGIPAWSADRWLNFTELRHDAEFSNLSWEDSAGQLRFTVRSAYVPPAQYDYQDTLSVLIPPSFTGRRLQKVMVNGAGVNLRSFEVNGQNLNLVTNLTPGDEVIAQYQPKADLEISMAHTPDVFVKGDPAVLTFTVSNTSGAAAENILVKSTAPLPAGVSIAGSSAGCAMDPLTRQFTCPEFSLAPAARRSLTIMLAVSSSAPAQLALGAEASSSSAVDPDPANNSIQRIIQVLAPTAGAVTPTAQPTPAGRPTQPAKGVFFPLIFGRK